MLVKWMMEEEDAVYSPELNGYRVVSKCNHDLGETIYCEMELKDPYSLMVENPEGIYKVETYKTNSDGSLSVSTWEKVENDSDNS